MQALQDDKSSVARKSILTCCIRRNHAARKVQLNPQSFVKSLRFQVAKALEIPEYQAHQEESYIKAHPHMCQHNILQDVLPMSLELMRLLHTLTCDLRYMLPIQEQAQINLLFQLPFRFSYLQDP